jgi:subtilisin family serine protease
MNKRFFSLTVLFLLFSLLVLPAFSLPPGGEQALWRVADAPAVKIAPAVQAHLASLQQDETITVIVQLRQQAKLPPGKNIGRAEQASGVVEALKVTAEKTQGAVKNLLETKKSQGRVQSYIPFWIFNGFSVTATADVIQELAAHPDVLSITPDQVDIVPASAPSALSNPEANISLINAPALWSKGYTGQGVVVASMDSGVSLSHATLATRWRGGSNSWYDPYGQHSTPADVSGHGTWTMGVMVGGDEDGSSIGVAPGAQWIAVKIFNDAGASTATAIHQGYQWLLDPDGNPSTSDAPQVVNNSWTFAAPGCNLDFEPDLQALRAAGILPVFAAGNGGPGTGTSYSPANNPSAFAVGAINNSSVIYGLSSRGPTTCGGSTGVFPELVAPGVNIYTTDLVGFYTTASGTSLAAPHVTGGLALLLSAFPTLTVSQQESTLLSSAVDLGTAGPDDVYGYGRLDLLAAYNLLAPPPPALTPLTPSGVLSGWNYTFTWNGLPSATWYLLEVQTSGGTQVYRKWFTSTQTGCAGGVNCSVAPNDISLPNGDYKWRILDYGTYGYGTNSAFLDFSLNLACYTLTVNINPSGGGAVNAPSQTCPGGYTAGSSVQLTGVSNAGFLFKEWSGDVAGTSNPVSVVMNGNKTITLNFKPTTLPLSPAGSLNTWDYTFTWSGLTEATWYLLEVQTSGGTQVYRKWFTSTQTACAGGVNCSVAPSDIGLPNGDYKWRILDYGPYGYGVNSAFQPFTLNLPTACHTLTVNITPAGAGTVNANAQNCPGGYTTGTVVQLTVVPNSGYLFKNWSGDGSGSANPLTVVMNADKTVTAEFKAVTVLLSPSGTLTAWDNTFTWTGLTNATWYLLEIYTPTGTQVFRKWYTSMQTNCSGGTACFILPPETAGLPNGDYKWRILDYGSYGYGTWTPYNTFTLNR